MLFTIYKEIQTGFGKLLNQYKRKTDKIRNMTIFEKISRIPEISRKLASLLIHQLLVKYNTIESRVSKSVVSVFSELVLEIIPMQYHTCNILC